MSTDEATPVPSAISVNMFRFPVRTDATALPDSVTAVVMQVDGQRTKCQNITLPKVSGSNGTAVYVIAQGEKYGRSNAGASSDRRFRSTARP